MYRFALLSALMYIHVDLLVTVHTSICHSQCCDNVFGEHITLVSLFLYIDNTQWRKLYIACLTLLSCSGHVQYTSTCTIMLLRCGDNVFGETFLHMFDTYMYNIHVHVTHNVIMLVITFGVTCFTVLVCIDNSQWRERLPQVVWQVDNRPMRSSVKTNSLWNRMKPRPLVGCYAGTCCRGVSQSSPTLPRVSLSSGSPYTTQTLTSTRILRSPLCATLWRVW